MNEKRKKNMQSRLITVSNRNFCALTIIWSFVEPLRGYNGTNPPCRPLGKTIALVSIEINVWFICLWITDHGILELSADNSEEL